MWGAIRPFAREEGRPGSSYCPTSSYFSKASRFLSSNFPLNVLPALEVVDKRLKGYARAPKDEVAAVHFRISGHDQVPRQPVCVGGTRLTDGPLSSTKMT